MRWPEAIIAGAGALPAAFRQGHAAFLHAQQQDDGGFRGPQGGSDLYYTRFALRALHLCAAPATPDPARLARAGEYLRKQTAATLVDRYCLLDGAAMLGLPLPETPARYLLQEALAKPNAYAVFLGSLCLELLHEERPAEETLLAALGALRASAGGFRRSEETSLPQTNATAAALSVLVRLDETPPEWVEAGTAFLAAQQTGDGGFRATPAVPAGDLLSSFTALTALHEAGAMRALRLAPLGRFARGLACAGGGFAGSARDPGPDAEYTYYGLGVLSLLAWAAGGR